AALVELRVVLTAELVVAEVRARYHAVPLPLPRDRRGAELGDELAPHLADARAGRDDPTRRGRRLELDDRQILRAGVLDRRPLPLDPVVALGVDVLDHILPGPGAPVLRAMHLIDVLPHQLGEQEERPAPGGEHLHELAVVAALNLPLLNG